MCPLLLHEKMGGSSGRPVHKFVFTCPGKAAALVSDERTGCVLFAFHRDYGLRGLLVLVLFSAT